MCTAAPSLQIQRRDLGLSPIGPMRPLQINVAGRDAGEQLHRPKNDPRQTPVGVVENDCERGSERRHEQRQQANRQDKKRDRHHHQIREQ